MFVLTMVVVSIKTTSNAISKTFRKVDACCFLIFKNKLIFYSFRNLLLIM